MIHIPVSEFKNEISESINKVAFSKERISLQQHGKDVAALISMEDLKLLEDFEKVEDVIDLKEALKALKEIRSGKDKVVSWNDVKTDFGL
jgi:prevent-host-death family protein